MLPGTLKVEESDDVSVDSDIAPDIPTGEYLKKKHEGQQFPRKRSAHMTGVELNLISQMYVDNFDNYHNRGDGNKLEAKIRRKTLLHQIVESLAERGYARTVEQVDQRIRDTVKSARADIRKQLLAEMTGTQLTTVPQRHIQIVIDYHMQKPESQMIKEVEAELRHWVDVPSELLTNEERINPPSSLLRQYCQSTSAIKLIERDIANRKAAAAASSSIAQSFMNGSSTSNGLGTEIAMTSKRPRIGDGSVNEMENMFEMRKKKLEMEIQVAALKQKKLHTEIELLEMQKQYWIMKSSFGFAGDDM